MDWIRIAVGMQDDPKLQRLADALKVRLPEAIGLTVNVLCALPDHAIDGDLSGIPPRTVERWSGWHGKRGAFFEAFITSLCNGDRVVSGWDKHNGGAIRDAARNRRKTAAYRERNRPNPDDGGGNSTGNSTGNAPSNSTGVVTAYGTERNGTKEEERGRDLAPPPSSAGLSARFAEPAHRDAYRGARRSARNPETFDAMLGSLADGMGAPRGKPLTWHQIGTAILQISGQPAPPPLSANVIGGFATKVPAEPIKHTLTLMPTDEPGTVRDEHGKVVWTPGDPPMYQPTPEQIAANGWSVAA